MTLQGIVHDGRIVLEKGATLPEGTRVTIIAEPAPGHEKPTLTGLLKLAGTLDDLPPDFAAEHDHYLHGTPKRMSPES